MPSHRHRITDARSLCRHARCRSAPTRQHRRQPLREPLRVAPRHQEPRSTVAHDRREVRRRALLRPRTARERLHRYEPERPAALRHHRHICRREDSGKRSRATAPTNATRLSDPESRHQALQSRDLPRLARRPRLSTDDDHPRRRIAKLCERPQQDLQPLEPLNPADEEQHRSESLHPELGARKLPWSRREHPRG